MMEPLSNRTELGSSNLNTNQSYENGYSSAVGQSPTRGKTFGTFSSGYGSTGFGGIGSAPGQGQAGQDRTGFREAGNGIQRSRSPGIYSGAIGSAVGGQGRESSVGAVGQQQPGSSIPNGRFLEIGQSFPPGMGIGMGGASKLGGANDNTGGFGGGYAGTAIGAGAGLQRIPTSPSSVGRASDRVFGSAGSTDSTNLGGLQDAAIPSQFSMSQSGEIDLPDHQSDEYNSFARRSPRPETNDRNGAFEGARKLWNAAPTSAAPSAGPGVQAQIHGPASLGGTPTRVNGSGSRPGVERSHSRFGQTAGNMNGNGAGAINSGMLSNGPLGVAGLGGMERPASAMSVKGAGVTSVGGVAGITDASGRMEGQALIDLIARVGRTEAAIADLGQQVASLNTIVKSLQISANQNGPTPATLPAPSGLGSNSGSNSSSGGSTPSIFGPPQITRTSASNKVVPVIDAGETPKGGALTAGTIESSSTITPTAAATTSTPDVAALTHQIAALSASVAQLQKMQSMAVRQGLEKRMGQSGANSPEERTGNVPASQPSGANTSPPGSNAAAAGTQQQAVQTPNQNNGHSQQGYFPAMSGNNGRPHNPRNQTGPATGMNNSIASALGSIGSRPRPHPSRAASSSVVPGAGLANGGQGYQNMTGTAANASERLVGASNGMSLGPMNLLSPGPGGRVERDRLEAVTPGGMSREGGPGGMTVTKWEHLPLTPELQRQIIKYGIGPPNKIQARALPFMLRGSDIIAQAPPTQERIITYVIPVVQLVLSLGVQQQPAYKGPCAIIVTTTVDQATQAHKLIRDIGAPLGVRTGLAVGASGADISADLANWHRNAVHVLVGTPARLNDVMVKHSNNGGLPGGDVRLLVLDEVDQLIARNLYENVTSICRVLPAPRSRNPTAGGVNGAIGTPGPLPSPAITSPFDAGMSSPFNPASTMPFPASTGSRFSSAANPSMGIGANPERQTCIFSNTIPTDVINFSQSIQVREPVRVLVRREGGTNASQESTSSGNLRHYYLYLALAGGAASRSEGAAAGPGTIGSGRAAGNQNTEVHQAKEFKLEALADLLLEYPLWQAIIHVGAQSTLDAVTSKLNSRQMENLSLSPDMSAQAKQAVYGKWRASAQSGRGPRFLVAFDTIVKPPEVVAAPLVVNFDLPRSVEGYAQRVSAANQADANRNDRNRNGPAPSSIVLNFIQAAGGDVEMLRSTECAYRFKCSEIPASFRDLF